MRIAAISVALVLAGGCVMPQPHVVYYPVPSSAQPPAVEQAPQTEGYQAPTYDERARVWCYTYGVVLAWDAGDVARMVNEGSADNYQYYREETKQAALQLYNSDPVYRILSTDEFMAAVAAAQDDMAAYIGENEENFLTAYEAGQAFDELSETAFDWCVANRLYQP